MVVEFYLYSLLIALPSSDLLICLYRVFMFKFDYFAEIKNYI